MSYTIKQKFPGHFSPAELRPNLFGVD